ncbi:MAG: 4-hydroxythreonine-4-phosphate dehydrogenase PdxA, partial [Verrucomicrobiae bacterium]|nr:4-hydroxythreonine-4-phosphate dehydrogenase PdxA [Verrucomicrobiae bacterium]
AGIPFIGQTEFLAGIAGQPRTVMMLLGTDDRGRWLRVVLATTHLPLKDVPGALTSDAVERAIRLASEACARLGVARRRVSVCGLNPHAGEGGLMGTEEREVIGPAIQRARESRGDAEGCDVDGPWPADTLFHQALRGSCDAVVAMYHDQGLAPLKLVAFDTGVNWTLGLPFVRTSPDHGTAYDLAGKGIARPDSMVSALRLALQLTQETRCPGTAGGQSPAHGT